MWALAHMSNLGKCVCACMCVCACVYVCVCVSMCVDPYVWALHNNVCTLKVHVWPKTYFISSISHELLGRLPPNGGHGDDPLYVRCSDRVVSYCHVAQLSHACVTEESQCMGKHYCSSHSFAVGCL